MKDDEIFDSLARNAFDFLERGIEEFDKSPKYSVIHFCAAVEMLLKARLMKEHWSLTVSKPEQANLAKFMAGDFTSVTLDEARARLRDVVGYVIDDEAFGSFRSLANHRNKMLHFFHADVDDDGEAKARIVAEHCRSWFHLHRHLKQWTPFFSDYRTEIARADRAMKGHRKYLSTKFKALKPELDQSRKVGNIPQKCSACGFKGAIPTAWDPKVATLRCVVCDHTETSVEIVCPHCSKRVSIANEGFVTCEHCGGSIEPEAIAEQLIDTVAAHFAAKDGDDSYGPVNCGTCDGYETVVQLANGSHFCTSCFDISNQISQCGWCSAYSTGNLQNSYSNGCGHCDGQWGHIKDD